MAEPTKRRSQRGTENGQGTSQEYQRFERMMKKLVSVPKKKIDARREAERKR
ncbi:MAG: hypothetical protein M3Q23_17525 [Actinomycetota bacterium]|nr:hypothetical protein [Actinomycetota bacterium]